MILEKLFLVLALFSSFGYMVLGLLAYRHQSKDKNTDRGWVLSPIWTLFPDSYNEIGKSLCVTGKKLFWISTIFTTIWLVMDHLLR